MALTTDLENIGVTPPEADLIGDRISFLALSSGTSTASTAKQFGPSVAGSVCELFAPSTSSAIIMATTWQYDKEITLLSGPGTVGTANAILVFPPTGTNFQGLATNASFTIAANKAASILRIGSVPGVAAERWSYFASN